jgi:hypothetical protein
MIQKQSVLRDLVSSGTRVLLKVAFAFEPLAPTAITVLMNQQLRRYKESRVIGNYKTRTRRLGKYHYRVELDMDLTGMQANHLIANLFPKQLSRFRRWFHD